MLSVEAIQPYLLGYLKRNAIKVFSQLFSGHKSKFEVVGWKKAKKSSQEPGQIHFLIREG